MEKHIRVLAPLVVSCLSSSHDIASLSICCIVMIFYIALWVIVLVFPSSFSSLCLWCNGLNYFWQDLQDVIVRLRTSLTQNQGFAVVSLIQRSGFMTWAWRKRELMSSLSVCIWSVGRRRMSQVRHLKLPVLLATSTWPSLPGKMLFT